MNTKSRYFLLGFVLLVFAYLSLNVLLNFTPLREQIVDRLERETFQNVEISFLYMSWEFRPTVRSIILERGEPDEGGRTTLELGNVELVLDWSNWWRTSDWGLENSLRRVLVNHATVEHRLASPRRERSTGSTINPSQTLRRLPDLPIEVNTWTLRLHRDRNAGFELEGRGARYRTGKDPFTTRITSIQNEASDITLRVPSLDPFWTKARVDNVALPDAVWELEGDRWSGSLEYVAADTGTLTASLKGVPGVVRDRPLPEAELSATVHNEAGVLRVASFTATSEYLTLSMTGEVDLVRNAVDLGGQYDLRVKERLNRFLPEGPDNQFRVSTSDTLTGDLSVTGPLNEYRVGGEFHLPRTEFDFARGESFGGTLALENLRGNLNRSGIVLTGGTLKNAGRTLRLDDGGFILEEGEVRTELNATFTKFPLGDVSGGGSARIRRYFGSVRSATIPVGFTGRMTPETFTGDFVVKDGRVDFEEGPLRQIRLLVSYSSRRGSPNVVRGEWIDPLGNDWTLKGRPTGPLTVRSRLNDVSLLLEKSPWLQSPYRSEIRPRRIDVEAEVENPLSPREGYEVRFLLDDASLEFDHGNPGSLPLSGSFAFSEEVVEFNDVVLGESPESGASLYGEIRRATNADTGGWTVNVRTRQFDVSPFLRLGVPSRTALNLDAEITGAVTEPEFSGSLTRSLLGVRNFRVRELSADLAGTMDQLRVENITGEMSDGQLSGSVEHVVGDRSTFDFTLSDFSLPELFPRGSWMERKTNGRMDLSVDITGDLTEPGSLNGTIRGSGRNVVLDHFPEIADIRDVARPSVLEEKLPIKPFEFAFPVKAGVVNVQNFKLHSNEIDFRAGGTTNLNGDLSLDMTLVLRGSALKRYLQDVLGNLYRQVGLQAGEKKLTIPLKIKGDLEKPILEIERSAVSNNFRKNLIEDLLTDPIGKPINELIDEIFLID